MSTLPIFSELPSTPNFKRKPIKKNLNEEFLLSSKTNMTQEQNKKYQLRSGARENRTNFKIHEERIDEISEVVDAFYRLMMEINKDQSHIVSDDISETSESKYTWKSTISNLKRKYQPTVTPIKEQNPVSTTPFNKTSTTASVDGENIKEDDDCFIIETVKKVDTGSTKKDINLVDTSKTPSNTSSFNIPQNPAFMPMGLNNPLLSGLNSLGMNGINVLNSLLMGQNAIFNYPNIFMNNQNAQNVQTFLINQINSLRNSINMKEILQMNALKMLKNRANIDPSQLLTQQSLMGNINSQLWNNLMSNTNNNSANNNNNF